MPQGPRHPASQALPPQQRSSRRCARSSLTAQDAVWESPEGPGADLARLFRVKRCVLCALIPTEDAGRGTRRATGRAPARRTARGGVKRATAVPWANDRSARPPRRPWTGRGCDRAGTSSIGDPAPDTPSPRGSCGPSGSATFVTRLQTIHMANRHVHSFFWLGSPVSAPLPLFSRPRCPALSSTAAACFRKLVALLCRPI